MSIFPERMAIVGSGPNERGTNNGKFIDASDKVIRFNNYVVGDKFSNDYGRRTDYWCRTFCGDIVERAENFERILIPLPLLDERCPYKYDFNARIYKGLQNVSFIPVEYFLDLVVIMRNLTGMDGLKPSTGLALLYWVYREQNNYINPDNVFGFTFFGTEHETHHYFSDKKWNRKLFITHNGEAEKLVFDYLSKGKL